MTRATIHIVAAALAVASVALLRGSHAPAAAGPAVAADATANDPLADKDRLKRLTQGPMRQFTFPDKAVAAPDVVFADAAGQPKALKDWRGKSVLVNFWAPWCASCRHELPSLQQLKQRMGKQDFEVLLVNIDADPAKAVALLGELGVDRLVSLQDGAKTAYTQLAGVGVPTSVLIDCRGRELGRIKGSQPWDADQSVLLVKAMIRIAACYDDQRDKL